MTLPEMPLPEKFGLAQSVRRVEDPRLLRGQGCYVGDIAVPGMLHGVVLRSPYAHARLDRLDLAAARAMPGVQAIYTAADLHAAGLGPIGCALKLSNRDGSPRHDAPRFALAEGIVRHVGDPVAFIVASSESEARDAAEAITADYTPLDAASELHNAPEAPLVWPDAPQNCCFDWEIGDAAAVDAQFAAARHRARVRVINNRIVVASMEGRAALAQWQGEHCTLTANTQGGWAIRNGLAEQVFNMPPAALRVITPDVGGGFGMKGFLYPEQVLVMFAARALGRPVRWVSTRSEAFLSDTQGRDNISDAEIALDEDLRFTALRVHTRANMGAYLSTFGPFVPTMAMSGVLAGVYGFRAIHARVEGFYTHTVPVDAYRGAGRPEANYLAERLIDEAARALGVDRAELRRRNMVPPEAMPYTTPTGRIYDSGEFTRILDAALARADWAGFAARRAQSEAIGRKRGIGLAYYMEATGGQPVERAEIRFADDGHVDVFVGTQSTGQGHETAYVMLTHHRLGVDPARIRIRQGDTDASPMGGGTGGARSLYSEGTAIYAAADTVISRGRDAAAALLEAAAEDIVFEGGQFTIAGTDRSVDILTLAANQRAARARGEDAATLDAAETIKLKAHTYPNGCHIAEVEVDPDTGAFAVLRYQVTDDVGRAINPMIVAGQVHGGVAQGYGQAVSEHTVYDASGQLLSGSFMDYALPRAADLPDIEVELIEIPCPTNPLGVKGAGEAGTVGSPPAIMNALIDALGGRKLDMPATPEAVWRALQAA